MFRYTFNCVSHYPAMFLLTPPPRPPPFSRLAIVCLSPFPQIAHLLKCNIFYSSFLLRPLSLLLCSPFQFHDLSYMHLYTNTQMHGCA